MIALGRLMLATLFSLAIWLGGRDDPEPTETIVLSIYMIFSAVIVAATWTDWWRDAKLAGPAHAVDIAVFTFLLTSTEGYSSPFFTFFVFLLLSSAIRWGWRATSLTAVLVACLYLLIGQITAKATGFVDIQPLVIRMGHLVILSLILIWFGVNEWRYGRYSRRDDLLGEPSLDDRPLEASLAAAMRSLKARHGCFVWHDSAREETISVSLRDGEQSAAPFQGRAINDGVNTFIYDLENDHALSRDEHRNLRPHSAADLVSPAAAKTLGLGEGLALPVRTGTGEGELFLEQIPDLSTDHIDFGEQLAADVAAFLQRHELLKAVEETAEARSRLMLARDLHDSVVQFLAGAAFRLEALKRTKASGRDLEPDLNELKDLMLQEQSELRSFIAALRSGSRIGVEELAEDLRGLAARLARQWDILCDFSAETTQMLVPSRLHLDAQQLLREAVANAVRHAGAKSITVKLRSAPDELRLDVINDGARYPTSPVDGAMPQSLEERVKLAGGALELSRGMGVTKVSLSLPVNGRLQ